MPAIIQLTCKEYYTIKITADKGHLPYPSILFHYTVPVSVDNLLSRDYNILRYNMKEMRYFHMSETIKLGILGYGNLGKGAEAAAAAAEDLDLTAVFTRRSPDTVKTCTCVPVYSTDRILDFQNKIDVLLLCGGSATDLPRQTPEYPFPFPSFRVSFPFSVPVRHRQ